MSVAPALRSDLEIKQVTKSGGAVYYVKDARAGSVYEFSAQEYALLSMFDGRTGLADLLARFKRQHGVELALDELEEFIGNLQEWGLLSQVAQAAPAPVRNAKQAAAPPGGGAPHALDDAPDVAGVEPPGLARDEGTEQPERPARYWRLFEWGALFSRVAQSLMPLRHVVYALPVLLAVALLVVLYNSHYIARDFARLWVPVPLIVNMVVALVTVSFWSKFMAGVVCRGMGGEVPGFGLTFRGVWLRFEVEVQGLDKMTRRQRMWMAATPLLVKLLLFSLGVLLWIMARASDSVFSVFGYIMAAVALISFGLTVNPMGRFDGYSLMSAYLGMPRLRRRSFGVLFSSFLPNKERQALERAMQGIDVRPFRIYAFACLLYTASLLGTAFYFAAVWLEFSYGGVGVVVFIAIVAALAYGMRGSFGRLRAAARDGGETTAAATESLGKRILTWTRQNKKLTGALIVVAVVSVLPYNYEPGGELELRPAQHLKVTAQTEGIVEEVYFKGGEWVAANTVIARLASYEQEKNVGVTRAQISEQEATLQKLLTTPRPEQVALAEAQVETARARAEYEKVEFKRQTTLYQKQVISEQEYLKAKAEMDRAVNLHVEARANLELTLAGPHPEQIAAVRAELERLRERLRYDEETLKRTRMVMPIDARLTNAHLYDLVGTYVKEGILITEIDNDRTMLAEIRIPEVDVEGIRVDAEAKLKIWTYPVDLVRGKVTRIDPVAEKTPYGRVVKVTIEVPNEDFLMKAGMTGYGKVSVGYMPTIAAFTRWLVRFITVEVWSWIP